MYSDLFSLSRLYCHNRSWATIMAAYRNPWKYTQALIITHKYTPIFSFPLRGWVLFFDSWGRLFFDITPESYSLTTKNRRKCEKLLDTTPTSNAKIGKIVSKCHSSARKWLWRFIGEKVRKSEIAPMPIQRAWKSRLFLLLFLLYKYFIFLYSILLYYIFSITPNNRV